MNEEHGYQVGKDIRHLNEEMPWWKVSSFPQNIPRHAFVLWLASKGKLVTQDKLAKWQPAKDWWCPLCLQVEDSYKHLFFGCEYSKNLWEDVQTVADMRTLNDLEDYLTKLFGLPYKNNIWSIERRLCIADTVYHIWLERNARHFQQKEVINKGLLQLIINSIRSRLLTLKVKSSNAVKEVEFK
ncbi:RNA-directed DNA polymerase, eukaryota, reverse transcriptase zinc-binding domain protein [Tanacetum coccineum]